MKEIDHNLVPKNLLEFEKMFATEHQCIEYIIRLKYKDGVFECSICGCKKCWCVQQYRYQCSKCKHRESISG